MSPCRLIRFLGLAHNMLKSTSRNGKKRRKRDQRQEIPREEVSGKHLVMCLTITF